MKLLLISPKSPESFWDFTWARRVIFRDERFIDPPLGLATIAALTPPDWEVTIVDENVQPLDWNAEADVVGVGGMVAHASRMGEILKRFRERRIYTVVGGAAVSANPLLFAGLADTVVLGEAENAWPRFCEDLSAGRPQRVYREEGEVDLALSPIPRYDLLDLRRYQKIDLQFSRGCPYVCDFCEVVVSYGRKPRTKTLEQMRRELDFALGCGVDFVFLVDDNLIGSLPEAKKFLEFLAVYQEEHGRPFRFGTQASLNMAYDPALLDLFSRAGFDWVFVGVETPNVEGLRESGKTQNLRRELGDSVRAIQSRGIDVYAGMIVGFDADDRTIFDRQYDFLVSSGISVAMLGLLMAVPGTPLFVRLQKEGRLRPVPFIGLTSLDTNVLPLRMSYSELIAGHRNLLRRLLEDRAIQRRVANKLSASRDPFAFSRLALRRRFVYFWRLLRYGVFPGGRRRAWCFFASLFRGIGRRGGLDVVAADWITALSLKDYADRFFGSGGRMLP